MLAKNPVKVRITISFNTDPPGGKIDPGLADVELAAVYLRGAVRREAAKAVLDHLRRSMMAGDLELISGSSLGQAIEVAAAGGKVFDLKE
jgi:hypothetical protein